MPDTPFYDLKRQFENAVKKAGLEGVTFQLRLMRIASPDGGRGSQDGTGDPRHKSILMTQRYSHLSPANKKSALDALEKALSGAVWKSP